MTDIDAHVRRLWRHRGTTLPTPRRGPARQLDLDDLLDAAVALADAEGLAAVSTRAVAARLGRTAMALEPYVGTKDQLLALMQDHAVPLPAWPDPPGGLGAALLAWAEALFAVYLEHPWLTELSWAQAAHGPNERDWLERLLGVLADGDVPPDRRATAVTMLYATVRACAETAAAYRHADAAGWLAEARATREQVPGLAARYPLTASLPPVAADWRDAPRSAVSAAVTLIASAIQ